MAHTETYTYTGMDNQFLAPQDMLSRSISCGPTYVWQSKLITCLTTADSGSVIPLNAAIDISSLEHLSADIMLKSNFTADRTMTLAVRVGNTLSGADIDTDGYYQDFTPTIIADGVSTQLALANFVANSIIALTSLAPKTNIRKRWDFPCKYIQIMATLSGGGLTAQTIYTQFTGQYK